MNRKVGLFLGAVVVVGGILFLVLRDPGAGEVAAVEELQSKALDPAAEPAVREQAVLALARKGAEGKEALKNLLQTSTDPAVKSSAILALTEIEAWDSMPLLIAALDDPSETVRARAGACTTRFIGKDYGFKAAAPADQRKVVVRIIRAEYAQMAASPPPRYQNPPPQGNQP